MEQPFILTFRPCVCCIFFIIERGHKKHMFIGQKSKAESIKNEINVCAVKSIMHNVYINIMHKKTTRRILTKKADRKIKA